MLPAPNLTPARLRRIWRAILLAGLLAVAVSPARAADDLLSIYQTAVRADPLLRQAQAAREATAELRPQARSALLPSISLSASHLRNEDFDASSRYGVQLAQPLFRYSSLVLQRQVEAQVGQAELEYVAAEQELMLRVAQAYFNVLAAGNAVHLARAELSAIERQLEQAEQRFEVGLIAVTDVEEARARRDLARAAQIDAGNRRASALEALRELSGREHSAVRPLRRQIPLQQPDPADVISWQQTAQSGNPRLIAARRASEASLHNVDIRRGERYPTLDLTASAGRSDIGGATTQAGVSDNLSVGVQLTAPLYRGGRLDSQVRQAQHLHTLELERLQALHRSVQRNTADAYRGVESSILRVQALEQALSSTQRALEAVEAGFAAGTRTTVDVLNAQRERFRAEGEHNAATYEYLLNTLRLRLAAGLLEEEDLVAINELLTSN